MWQSSGKYVPIVSQLKEVAPAIIGMGCFDRVENNGGAFEQVNLLAGENPNRAVREWTAPFHAAGIQTHMLERGLNALRMNPVPADVRELMYKVKKAQGTDISRSFCGPGFSPVSILEVARAGVDYLDVAVEPLSWGKVHPDVITIREMLKADGFIVKDLNMEAYMQVRTDS